MLDLLDVYFSEWYLCVWNCKGELRKKWEKEPEHWLDIGYFKVPVKEKVALTQEEIFQSSFHRVMVVRSI